MNQFTVTNLIKNQRKTIRRTMVKIRTLKREIIDELPDLRRDLDAAEALLNTAGATLLQAETRIEDIRKQWGQKT